MSSYKTELIIENTTFKVLDSDINYFQHIQNSGLPAGDIAGGMFSVKIESSSGPQFDMLAEWMFSKSQMKKGILRFYKKDGISKLFDFEFYDAHCINYHEHFDGVNDSAMTTTITVSPGITRIGSLVKERLWKVSELKKIETLSLVEYPNEINPTIIDGNWLDKDNKIINEAFYGDNVKFEITTNEFPNASKIFYNLFDYDGILNPDDLLKSSYTSYVTNNKSIVELTLEEIWKNKAKSEPDKVVEAYFSVNATVKGKKISRDLPLTKESYLKIHEKEVKISVIVELPHSRETGWGAKGLAGHTAMAIGGKFYDYGPDYSKKVVNESTYDYDFNKDGDKDDLVDLSTRNIDFKFAPGRPWWGEMISQIDSTPVNQITLDQALNFIKVYGDQCNIYGEIYLIELFVNESQAQKMKDWWENRYKHLKVYSVLPWTGEQCTTTVKEALQEGGIKIPDITQKPSGILFDFQNSIFSTSTLHLNEKPSIIIIKEENADWNPKG